MTVLIQRRIDGEAVYTKLEPIRSGFISQKFNYKRDDKVFEQHRAQENHTAFSYVAKELKKMRIEARNGFRELSRVEQSEAISSKKKEIENLLREEGSFFSYELPSVISRTSRLVERVYAPYLKWARKK